MSRTFAIVPAAGESRRMGQPKLLLPWGEGVILDAVLNAWQAAAVDEIVVVTNAQQIEIQQLCRSHGVHLVIPECPPAEMKDSVVAALNYLGKVLSPRESDLWLLAPADLPTLSPVIISQVVDFAKENPQAIVIPQHSGRNGHPAAFPWPLADDVARLEKEEGVNALLQRHGALYLQCSETAVPNDIDTPDDYRNLHNR